MLTSPHSNGYYWEASPQRAASTDFVVVLNFDAIHIY